MQLEDNSSIVAMPDNNNLVYKDFLVSQEFCVQTYSCRQPAKHQPSVSTFHCASTGSEPTLQERKATKYIMEFTAGTHTKKYMKPFEHTFQSKSVCTI